MKVFDDSFLSAIKNILDTKCVDGTCIKAKDICNELNLTDKEVPGIISTIIRWDLFPEYKSYLGPGRGIGRKDTEPKKTANVKATKELDIPEHFLDELQEVLAEVCSDNNTVPTKDVVEKMDTAVFKNSKAMVSAALKRPEFSQYGTKAGKGGGVYLKAVDVELTDEPISNLENEYKDVPAVLMGEDSDEFTHVNS